MVELFIGCVFCEWLLGMSSGHCRVSVGSTGGGKDGSACCVSVCNFVVP